MTDPEVELAKLEGELLWLRRRVDALWARAHDRMLSRQAGCEAEQDVVSALGCASRALEMATRVSVVASLVGNARRLD